MPYMAVLVSNVQPINSGVLVAFLSMTSNGFQAFGDTEVDFGISSVVTNQQIEAAAKAAQLAQNNITIGVLDKVILFGGRVS